MLIHFIFVSFRDVVDKSDSTKTEEEQTASTAHVQQTASVSPSSVAEDAALKTTKESEN